MARTPELKECRDCGAAVFDVRAHKRFHANLVTVAPQPSDRPPIRFIGETQPQDRTPTP